MATMALDYDGLWVEADLDADPARWARDLVRVRWHEENLPPDNDRADAVAGGIEAVLRVSKKEDPLADLVMLLYPRADEFVVTSVSVSTEEADLDVTVDDVIEGLRLPVEMLEQPIDEQVVETRSGVARRLVQRYLSPTAPGVESIWQHLAYVLVVPDVDESHVIIMSATFDDLVDAEDWQPTIDELAAQLLVETDATQAVLASGTSS